MIVFDTETTGLIEHEALPLEKQPRIIEIGAVLVRGGQEVDYFSSLVNPGVPLSPDIVRITGLRDEDLKGAPTFIEIYGALNRFFQGEDEVVAHNCRFDQMMLVFELRRFGLEHSFKYPMRWVDSRTVYPGRLQRWAQERDPTFVNQTHRALDDARLLARLYHNEIMLQGGESGIAPWGGAGVDAEKPAQAVLDKAVPEPSRLAGQESNPSTVPPGTQTRTGRGSRGAAHAPDGVRTDRDGEPARDPVARKRKAKQ